MNKKPIIIGNWKMRLGLPESISLANELRRKVSNKKAEVVVCPSFVSLTEVSKILKKTDVALGAQDCFWEAKGSYTGEVSANYLKEAGCDFVILGHSERRANLGETDEMVHKKVKMALTAGLVPVICVGETFEQRQEGNQDYALIQQVTKALEGIDIGMNQRVIIAYEPVWVIGTGNAIAPSDARLAQQIISHTLLDIFPDTLINSNFMVIYGGSVDGQNVKEFNSLPENDGFLVGGASLQAESFSEIINNL